MGKRASTLNILIALVFLFTLTLIFGVHGHSLAQTSCFSGKWNGSWQSYYGGAGGTSATIVQSGSTFHGTLNVTGTGPCPGYPDFYNLPLSGGVSGNVATIYAFATCPSNGCSAELIYTSGTVSGNKMDGTYTLEGSNCYYYDSGTFSLIGSLYSASGTVTSGGAALAGVTVNLTGAATMSTTTDGSGKYSFTGLSNGSYIITPNMDGYTFNPASLPMTVCGASVPGENFTAVFTTVQTRALVWAGAGAVSIWTFDNSNNYLGSKVYGPFSGWTPVTFTRRAADGTGRLLWSSTGGAASIWTLDNANNYLSSKVYGPYSGWTPLTYASNPSDGTGRLIWSGTGGSVSIWKLDASDNYVSSLVYGPYSGWKPTTYVFNTTSGTGRLIWAGTGGAASIWKLDASDNYVSSLVFGPFNGWSPVAYTFNSANGTSILTWASTAGQASIWKFDSSENYLGNYVYGPYSGWSPLTCGFNSADGTPRLIWSGTGGMASIWSLDSSGSYLGSTVYGPLSGWMPIGYW